MLTTEEMLMTLRPGEKTFCLRAGDKFAPEIIERWATMVEDYDRNVVEDVTKQSARQMKIKQARALAHEMRAWQELNGCKVPD